MRNLVAGFTLLETTLVLALLSMVLMFSVSMGINTYRGYVYRSEKDVLAALLAQARSNTQNNLRNVGWGVCADASASKYVLFPGVYVPHDPLSVEMAMGPGVVASSTPARVLCAEGGVVFTRLSATTSSTTIFIMQNVSTSTIAVTYEGTIIW